VPSASEELRVKSEEFASALRSFPENGGILVLIADGRQEIVQAVML